MHALLYLAEAIQLKIKQEHDENVKKTLENDLQRLKKEIGKRVLELPDNVPVFPPVEVKTEVSEQIDMANQQNANSSPASTKSITIFPSENSSSLIIDSDIIGSRFDEFLKSKNTKPKAKSKIPKSRNQK